jgi:hypothetical protein
MNIIVAIPHSHTWFWTQTCVSSLVLNPPVAEGCNVKVVVINNSPWSPAIKGIKYTRLGEYVEVIPNYKNNKFHASALDCVVESCEFDYLMALETDVMALRPTWLQWFVDQMRTTDYAVGMWHHESFVNPSCTLYRGDVLRKMSKWCSCLPDPEILRWGPNFEKWQPISDRQPERDYLGWYDDNIAWIAGPFAEKRGWPQGAILKEQPSGQLKGPGWYEPGQQLHHWAVEMGYTYSVCQSITSHRNDNLPLQTMYGSSVSDLGRQLEADELIGNAETVHLWGGTRALDIIKHDVTCEFVKANTPMWLAREARFWRKVVPMDIQLYTIKMIRDYGWHITGQGSDHISDRDYRAAEYVKSCYELGGVSW